MFGYSDQLGCDFAIATNGYETLCAHYNQSNNQYESISDIPTYLSMLKGDFTVLPEEEIPDRLTFDELDASWDSYHGYDISRTMGKETAMPLVNLWECFLYSEHTFPKKKYKMFELVSDLGVRYLSYGNAGGGKYEGSYRSFLINYNGSNEIVSISFSTYYTFSKPDVEKTCIIVAIDDEKNSHHALQYGVENSLVLTGNVLNFYHSGKIAVGNKGSGKVSELLKLTEKLYPEIIVGDRFNIGTLVNDHLWNLDEPDVMQFVENLISYALVRDEFREMVKNRC